MLILKELIGFLINVKISGTVLVNLCKLGQEGHDVCRSGKHYIICCNCLLISRFLQPKLVDLKSLIGLQRSTRHQEQLKHTTVSQIHHL